MTYVEFITSVLILVTDTFLPLVDDYTPFAWVFLLRPKSDVAILILKFFKLVNLSSTTKLSPLDQKMRENWLLMNFFTKKEFCTNFLVLILHSKTQWYKKHINTCLMWHELYIFSLEFQFNSGLNVFPLQLS